MGSLMRFVVMPTAHFAMHAHGQQHGQHICRIQNGSAMMMPTTEMMRRMGKRMMYRSTLKKVLQQEHILDDGGC